MSYRRFRRRLLGGKGFLPALIESRQGTPLTEAQIRHLYEVYLGESGARRWD